MGDLRLGSAQLSGSVLNPRRGETGRGVGTMVFCFCVHILVFYIAVLETTEG